jgi:hypothetical protein
MLDLEHADFGSLASIVTVRTSPSLAAQYRTDAVLTIDGANSARCAPLPVQVVQAPARRPTGSNGCAYGWSHRQDKTGACSTAAARRPRSPDYQRRRTRLAHVHAPALARERRLTAGGRTTLRRERCALPPTGYRR